MTVNRHTLPLVVCLTTLTIAQSMWRRMMNCKDVVVARTELLSRYLPGGTG
jgi:hypothetical protein